MGFFTKNSLEQLRQRIDLVDLVSAHIDLKRAGAAFKACCPFHDERTPSFVIQRGDDHYHCFGCGAHGDGIRFVTDFLKLSFTEAVEMLAQRYHVTLEREEGEGATTGPPKKRLKELMEKSSRFFHFCLLHIEEGHRALDYLYQRGLDLSFIRRFEVGWAPTGPLLQTYLGGEFDEGLLVAAGLVRENGRSFFADRVTFPLRDAAGAVVGFSARKVREETFGGKYINSPETPLFHKSRFLFGLNYCRRRIAKEGRAIIVEGQIDALRLIEAGFNFTVAGLGTAFGEGQVLELKQLGLRELFLALDADEAGRTAAAKIGDLFQREGIEVFVVALPLGSDPDSLLNERGPDGFLELLNNRQDYLSFLVGHMGRKLNLDSPAGKSELVKTVSKQIHQWGDPTMVHESLRRLAKLVRLPEDVVGVGHQPQSQVALRQMAKLGPIAVDGDQVLEQDLLRWLLLMTDQPRYRELAEAHLSPEALRTPICRQIYTAYLALAGEGESCDLLSLAMRIDPGEGQKALSEILKKRVNRERAEGQFLETIQKLLERNWMEERERVKQRIQLGEGSEEEILTLAKEFDRLKTRPPEVTWPT